MAKSRLSTAEIRQRVRKVMPGRQGEEIIKALDGIDQDMVKIKAWMDDTKTKMDTLVTKMNADAGITDTNYVSISAGADI